MNPDSLAKNIARTCPERSEVFVKRTFSRNVEWDGDEVKSINVKQDSGAGLRVLGDDRIGFAHANRSRLSAPDLIDRARQVRSMKAQDRQRTFPGIPPRCREPAVDRFDGTLRSDPESRINRLSDRLGPALEEDDVQTLQAQYGESWSEVHLFVDGRPVYRSRSSSYSFGVWAVCERDGDVESGYDGQTFTHFDRLDVDSVLESARNRGQTLLGATPPEEYHGPAILDDRAASSLLGLASSMVNGETIRKDRSAWGADRRGDRLASDQVTIVDDPTLPDLTGSGEYDAYGEPMEPVTVLEDGVYREFLTNKYVANRLECENNHRTSRGFRSTPGVGTTNFRIKPGNRTFDQLTEELGTGPVITGIQSGSGMDAVNGRFSVGCSGIVQSNGEGDQPFTEGTISGSLEDLLGSVGAVGSEPPRGRSTASPPLLVETVHLGGSG